MMNLLVSTWLFVMTSTAVLGASLSAGSMMPSERGFPKARGPFTVLTRRSRNAMDFLRSDCKAISQLTRMKEQFQAMLDHNDDGKSSPEEVKQYMRNFRDNIKDEFVASFIRRRDTNGNGMIDFIPEYIVSVDLPPSTEEAKEWFHLHDADDNGFVTATELMRPTMSYGMSPEEAKIYIDSYYMVLDNDKDNQLSFDEFKAIYV